MFRFIIIVTLLLFPTVVVAQEGNGSWTHPYFIDDFPYAHRADTSVGVEWADHYLCAPNVDMSGPEVIYQFELNAPTTVTAWVEGDIEGQVDIDVHILSQQSFIASQATSCLARGGTVAEAHMERGPGWIIVDTQVRGGEPLSGTFTLRADIAVEDEPGVFVRERQVGKGVLWRREVHKNLFGGPQTINMLEIDLSDLDHIHPEVVVEPRKALERCERTSSIGDRELALAAVNAGFFAVGCKSLGILKIGGKTISRTPWGEAPRAAFGICHHGEAHIRHLASWDRFEHVDHAISGAPILVRDGVADVTWREERVSRAFALHRHPRTAACVTGDNYLLFVTVDGRTKAGIGTDLLDLADFLVTLGCDRAINYDGGGSTTMWIWPSIAEGVVNYPADNLRADHRGERGVANAWLVWAVKSNRPPRFTTSPPTAHLNIAESWTYTPQALDLDFDDLVYDLDLGPRGMRISNETGLLTWTPSQTQHGFHEVVITVGDISNVIEQRFEIFVQNPNAPTDQETSHEQGCHSTPRSSSMRFFNYIFGWL